ncbi:MAG TPA: response regulator transcription factor [Trueperaceae bacterium]|nr:response regulator transcription factor [Trueperaceae bacterium]
MTDVNLKAAAVNSKTQATVVLVEDDVLLLDVVTLHLEQAGFTVVKAPTAAAGWAAAPRADVLVLDWMLPDEPGVALLRRLRYTGNMVPVLMLTARARESERIEGLDAGADDYLVKPFGVAELVARIRALLRRTQPATRVRLGPVVIDIDRGLVSENGEDVNLTRREFGLLACLAENAGRVFSRQELLDKVWGDDFIGTDRTVDQHVAQLRSRFGEQLIETVRGRGYRLASAAGQRHEGSEPVRG